MKSLGQIAFEAYKESCIRSAKTVNDSLERMILGVMSEATWDTQALSARHAWEAAAGAIHAIHRNTVEEVSLGGGY